MKIIKGKGIFIMLFLTSVDNMHNMADIFLTCLGSERRTQIIAFFAFSVKLC